MTSPIHITPPALEEVKRLFRLLKVPQGYVVRISIRKKLNEGEVPYTIGFDLPDKNDLNFELNELTFSYSKLQSMQLVGITIDFVEEERGFVFKQ